jgi:hypothetical protein
MEGLKSGGESGRQKYGSVFDGKVIILPAPISVFVQRASALGISNLGHTRAGKYAFFALVEREMRVALEKQPYLGIPPGPQACSKNHTDHNVVVFRATDLAKFCSSRPCQSSQPVVSVVSKSERIDEILAPVLQITPKLHDLCRGSSVASELFEFSDGVVMPPFVEVVRSNVHEILVVAYPPSQALSFKKSNVVDYVLSLS